MIVDGSVSESNIKLFAILFQLIEKNAATCHFYGVSSTAIKCDYTFSSFHRVFNQWANSRFMGLIRQMPICFVNLEWSGSAELNQACFETIFQQFFENSVSNQRNVQFMFIFERLMWVWNLALLNTRFFWMLSVFFSLSLFRAPKSPWEPNIPKEICKTYISFEI